MSARADHSVASMTWDEVGRRIKAGAIAILPIGAGAKQHGFHLPMQTDLIQAEALATDLADHLDALIWPTVSYGYYPAFTDYAGSCSLSAATFEAVVREIVDALVGYGCRHIVVLNTGMSTMAPIDRALARHAGRVLHLKIYDGPRYRAEEHALVRQAYGSHADQMETAIMLALAPEVVMMSHAEASSAKIEGPLTPLDPSAKNYSRSGSYGDPTLATAGDGGRLLAAIRADMIEAVTAFCVPLARQTGRVLS